MKKFAVFGDPIAHSISPRLHNLAINALNLDAFYGRVWLKDGKKLKETFFGLALNGANITVPHKEIAFEICDEIDDYAQNIGSINTLVSKNGKIYGYNTDAPGFIKAISRFGDIKTALIIGAGGTSRALAYAMNKASIQVEILNRSDKRAQNFKDYGFYTWENFSPKSYDLVVNATSAGLKDENLPAPSEILNQILDNSKFAFDVIYGKQTPFLRTSTSKNLATQNGADMLLFQAVLAFNHFFDDSLDENKIENAMKIAFSL